MKKIIRIIIGALLFALGVFFIVTAVAAWLSGQASHLSFGALCGSLAFFITGFMIIGEDAWHNIASSFLNK